METVQIIAATYQGINRAIPLPYWNPGALIIFAFFPSGFSFFLGGVRPFCGTLRGLFAEGPTSGRPCRYLKRRQLLLTENKKARNIISLCVSVVIFCERWSDHNVKCVGWWKRDGFWQLLVWDQIILIDYFSHRKSSRGGGMFSERNHKWKYQFKWEISRNPNRTNYEWS